MQFMERGFFTVFQHFQHPSTLSSNADDNTPYLATKSKDLAIKGKEHYSEFCFTGLTLTT